MIGGSREATQEALAAAGVGEGARARLALFLELLERFQRVTNLRGGKGGEEAWTGCVAALVGVPFLSGVETLVDVGSGNGLPAIPLLVARPGMRGVLLEPRERRWAFLGEVVRELGLDAEVRRERGEAHRGGPYGALSCRGLAAKAWMGLVPRLVRPGGLVMYWTGQGRVSEDAGERVVPSPLATPGGGQLHVWRRCFT